MRVDRGQLTPVHVLHLAGVPAADRAVAAGAVPLGCAERWAAAVRRLLQASVNGRLQCPSVGRGEASCRQASKLANKQASMQK